MIRRAYCIHRAEQHVMQYGRCNTGALEVSAIIFACTGTTTLHRILPSFDARRCSLLYTALNQNIHSYKSYFYKGVYQKEITLF